MKIENIFAKDINRAINGVIKADQNDKAYNELEEYVITREVDKHLRRFVDAFLLGIDRKKDADVSAKMGVWVSGFFGSGKSHFIKILSYLLNNQPVIEDGKEPKAPLDFFIEKVAGDSALQADLRRMAHAHTEVILFNIDSKAEPNSRDAILQVFLKVFNEHLGFCGDHPEVAHMERFLDNNGKYQAFIDTLASDHNLDWRAQRDSYQFYPTEVADALSKVLNQSINDPQAWIDNLEKGLALTIENFAKWVKAYLDKKGSDQRLVFLADEVGQFIGGQSQLMLNLQTITENLGTTCNGRAWVVVTSQEDIEAVVGGAFEKDRSKDFSKIQGRFTTRLSLSGSNADEVIQRRLLSKTADAEAALKALFTDKADILRNQITFRDAAITLRPFTDTESFVDCYPFPPYQFLLVQKIFEASRQFGATGGHLSKGERSMLDAFQTAALAVKDKPLGALVPLDFFYPSIEGFLEGVVRTAINRVENIPDRTEIDARVLKTLFLIRYVEEVAANIDNLVTFFVDEVDADKRALRGNIEASLLRLERDTLISRNGDRYAFLTNEERDINKEIKAQDYGQTDLHKLLGEVVFEDVLKDLRRYRFAGNGKDFDLTRLIDLAPLGNRNEGSLTISVLTPLAPDFASFTDPRCIEMSMEGNVGQLVIKLRDDQRLADEITTYIQTANYLRLKADASLPQTTKRIHDDKRLENTGRRNRINSSLTQMVEDAKFFVLGNEKTFTGGPKAAVEAGLRYLVENGYSKLSYVQHSPTDHMAEIRRLLADPTSEELDLLGGSQNAKALKELLDYIELLSGRSQSVNLGTLVNERFARHPYGWKELDTLLLVCRLFKAGQIELNANGGKLQANEIYAQIDGSTKWNRVSLSRRKTVEKADIQAVRNIARDLFGTAAPDGEDDLHAWLRTRFDDQSRKLEQWSALATTGNYPGTDEIADLQGILRKILANRDSYAFLAHIKANGANLQDSGERYQRLDTFYSQQRPQWDALRAAYRNEFEPNAFFLARDADAAAALTTVQSILSDPRPYNRIKESAALIATLRTCNETVVAERRADALAKVDPQIETIRADLAGIGVDADFSNKCLKPIQDIRKRIELETRTGQLTNLVAEAADAAEMAHTAIEDAVEAAKKAVAYPVSNPEPSKVKETAAAPFAPAPKVQAPENFKPRRQISAKLPASKPYLETRQDVDEYLAAFRQQLEAAIDSNARVEIL